MNVVLNKIIDNKWFKWFNILLIGTYFILVMMLDIDKSSNKNISNNIFFKNLNNPYLILAITTYTILIPALKYFKAYKLLFKGKFDMDLLITMAMHISYIFSVVIIIINLTANKNMEFIIEPIGLLYVFDTIGISIDAFINKKNSIEKVGLESLQQKEVMLKNGKMIKIENIKKGDIVMFHQNEIIQFDGVVESGEATIDTSNINGESKPYYAKTNSAIISGSKLLSKHLYLKISNNYKNSTLNKLIEMINKTNKNKPKMQQLANKIFKWFTPSVLFITLISFIIWILIGNFTDISPMLSNNKNNYIYNSFFIMVSILGIACPCAMTMTAPLISFVSSQSYWRNNIIFSKVEDMEKLNKVTTIVLDKTGTLTTNKMEIIQEFGNKEHHGISASLEETTYHPIALSIFNKYKQYINKSNKIMNVINVDGKGLGGIINNKTYFIGKVKIEELEKTFKTKIEEGTYVGLFKNKKLVAGYVLKTQLAKGVKSLIKFLKRRKITPIILSGDNETSTKAIANQLEIEYRSSQTPEDKAKYIQELQKKGEVVAMMGDGLNDSIAIKYADVSITFSFGSAIANSYSSITLLNHDLRNISYLFKMAKHTNKNYKIALGWAIGFNMLLIPLAMIGLISPYISALAMFVSTIILQLIILNFWFILRRSEKHIYGRKTSTKVKGDKEKIKEIMKQNSGHDHDHSDHDGHKNHHNHGKMEDDHSCCQI